MAIKGVGQNFRYLRVMLGTPQQEVAKQAGLSQRSVRMFEIENTDIMLSNLISLCNAISMPVATVIYGEYYDEMRTIDGIVKKFHENSEYRKRVGDIVRKKRKECGYTQRELAEMACVIRTAAVGHIERGNIPDALSNISLYHICKVLCISYCELERLWK